VPNKTLTIEQVLLVLAETPARIADLTTGLSPALLREALGPGEWSANEVLAHLRACADVRGDCIPAILAEDRPALRAIDPRTWIKQTNYLELEFRPSLRAFAEQRSALLAILETLPRGDWSRTVTVTGAGRVLERDVLFYGRWLAGHERPHIRQIARIADTARTQGKSL